MFLYIIIINIDEIKYWQYPDFPNTDTIKDDQLKKELEIIPDIIKDIRDKKINDIETIFRTAIDNTFEINDPLLVTHFLFKAVEEVNNDLIKKKNHTELILEMMHVLILLMKLELIGKYTIFIRWWHS